VGSDVGGGLSVWGSTRRRSGTSPAAATRMHTSVEAVLPASSDRVAVNLTKLPDTPPHVLVAGRADGEPYTNARPSLFRVSVRPPESSLDTEEMMVLAAVVPPRLLEPPDVSAVRMDKGM